ncbi:hypothetical protein D3C76_1575790 [compost metagenome]
MQLIARQGTPQQKGHQDHQHAGHPVDGTPAAEGRQSTGDGTCQQNAEQQAAHDHADGFTAFCRVCQSGGEWY